MPSKQHRPKPQDRPKKSQTLLDIETDSIVSLDIHEADIDIHYLQVFQHPRPIGLAPGFTEDGYLAALTIVDSRFSLLVKFYPNEAKRRSRLHDGRERSRSPPHRRLDGRKLLERVILLRDQGDLFAFEMGPLALALANDHGLRIKNAIDIPSAYPESRRRPLAVVEAAVTKKLIFKENISATFLNPIYKPGNFQHELDLFNQAWLSQFLPTYENGAVTLATVKPVNTTIFEPQALAMIVKLSTDSLKLDQMKPLSKSAEVSVKQHPIDGTKIISSRFENRPRRNQTARFNIKGGVGGEGYSIGGQIMTTLGKTAAFETPSDTTLTTLTATMTLTGRDITAAEYRQAQTVLSILQGAVELLDQNPWIQNIWFPDSETGLVWPEDWSPAIVDYSILSSDDSLGCHTDLNPSQQSAVNSMLSPSDNHRIVVIQGPPGTGKTSVIASFVQYSLQLGQKGIWLTAQSNVAVKNIAEKLQKVGFHDWKIIVSEDFHHDWHEHLYENIKTHMINSAELSKTNFRTFIGCQVILSTISTLSTSSLKFVTKYIPITTLVVDEASQIEIGAYSYVFTKHTTLRKVCFVGDNKQLAPFGSEEIENLQSIFEVSHLQPSVLFLNTQYRMPPQIGDFISHSVYDNKLKSNPLHPVSETTTACYFIDVKGSEIKDGKSWKNDQEIEILMKLSQQLQDKNQKMKIITGYEAQRGALEKALQEAGLQWGDTVFTVDSFQGNEEDFILISVVRTRALGFLENLRRTNVMLTRCKKGMFIATKREWVEGVGSTSLVGQMAEHVEEAAWLTEKDIDAERYDLHMG